MHSCGSWVLSSWVKQKKKSANPGQPITRCGRPESRDGSSSQLRLLEKGLLLWLTENDFLAFPHILVKILSTCTTTCPILWIIPYYLLLCHSFHRWVALGITGILRHRPEGISSTPPPKPSFPFISRSAIALPLIKHLLCARAMITVVGERKDTIPDHREITKVSFSTSFYSACGKKIMGNKIWGKYLGAREWKALSVLPRTLDFIPLEMGSNTRF